MLLRRLTNSAATLLPSFVLATSASACFVQPGQGSNDVSGDHAAGNLGEILQQSMVEFPLSDVEGNDVSVGRLVYGVARSDQGSLDFFYQFFNYSPENIGITSIKVNGFAGVNTDVHTLASGDESLPTAAERSADGSRIDFLFDDNNLLSPGDRTITMVVQTDAHHYEEVGSVDLSPFLVPPLNASTSANLAEAQVSAFAPRSGHSPAAVPLPAPMWSSLAGLVVTMIYVMRHK